MSDPDRPDPFAAFDGDRTVIKPGAGRGIRAAGATAAAAPAAAAAAPASMPALSGVSSLNPLVQAAAPLLAAAPRLRATVRHPDPAALRTQLLDAVQRFDAAARAQGLPHEQVVAASYLLCTFLDECAASTPWGGSGAWSAHSLLVHLHGEAWGGEKVFQLLQRLAQDVPKNRALLEFVWVVLTLGFEGRYRVLDNGRAQLEQLRVRLGQILRQQAGTPEPALSPAWQGVGEAPARLRDGIPMWVVAVAMLLLLAMVFAGFRLWLAARTDTAFAALQSLDAQAPRAPPLPPPVVAPPPRLAQLLAADINAGAVTVVDEAARSVVTVNGNVFDAGSAEVAARARPLFDRIGAAVDQVRGPVLVTGHTDSQPIRSLRFPSNWHLSEARAKSAAALLEVRVGAARVRAEGRADTEPVASNASAEGRAQNRRVEIVVTPAAAPTPEATR